MAFDSTERREYLLRLREQALVRMRADERAVSGEGGHASQPVSRRESLRWLGMAAVGIVPAIAALAGTNKAFALSPVSVRSAAPQYGAPSWVAPREPYPSIPVTGAVTTSRTKLGDATMWRDVWVQVPSQKIKKGGIGLDQVAAKEGFYADGWGGGAHALLAIADPEGGFDYIVRGNQTFYALVDGDMFACLVGPGVFLMHGSLFRMEAAKDGLAGVIAGFTQVGDQEAYRRDRDEVKINLEKGLPQEFWTRNGDIGWELNYIGTPYVARRGNILELTLRSNGYPSEAVVTIDLKAQKLLKTKFEGKEWLP